MSSVIYKLTFPNTDKVYIGQTTQDYLVRFKKHIRLLNSGNHHSTKLQKEWPECGMPTIDILEEVCEELLDNREQYWVSKYDSYRFGYNCTIGGNSAGVGYGHAAAKYSEEDYKCILVMLAYTEYSLNEIAEATSVSIKVVEAISSGSSHLNLKNDMPVEYAIVQAKNRHGQYQVYARPPILDPEGNIHYITNVSKFEKDNGIYHGGLRAVLLGHRKSCLGWRLPC